MDRVIDVLPSPAEALLSTVILPVIKKGRCDCYHSNTCSRVSQVVSAVFAGLALLSVVLMSTGIAPISPETYGFCIVVFLLGAQNALSLQKNIELGGYDKQNKLYKVQNDLLKVEIDRIVPLEVGLRREITRITDTASGLEHTLAESRAEANRIRVAVEQIDASLVMSKALNEDQSRQLDTLRAENEKLVRLVERHETLLARFEESLTAHTLGLGDKVVAIGASVDRLEAIEAKFGAFVEVSVGLKGQVEKLQQMQSGFQGILQSMSQGADLEKIYLEKEEALQAEQVKIVKQLRDLAEQEELFHEREAELLRRLDEEVFKLKELVVLHVQKSKGLVLRIIPLKVQNCRFSDMLGYIGSKNSGLVEEARADMRRRKLEKVSHV